MDEGQDLERAFPRLHFSRKDLIAQTLRSLDRRIACRRRSCKSAKRRSKFGAARSLRKRSRNAC